MLFNPYIDLYIFLVNNDQFFLQSEYTMHTNRRLEI